MLRIINIKNTNAEKFYIKGGHALLICINDIPEVLTYVEHINKKSLENIMQLYSASLDYQSVANMYYGLLYHREFYVYCQIYPDLSIT